MQQNHIYYLAALIDGEGYIDPKAIRISVSSTDLDILERAREYSDSLGNITGPYSAKLSTKPYWTWDIKDMRQIARLACAIAPLMSERRVKKILELGEVLALRSRNRTCISCGKGLDSKIRINAAEYCDSTCRTREWRKNN